MERREEENWKDIKWILVSLVWFTRRLERDSILPLCRFEKGKKRNWKEEQTCTKLQTHHPSYPPNSLPQTLREIKNCGLRGRFPSIPFLPIFLYTKRWKNNISLHPSSIPCIVHTRWALNLKFNYVQI